MSKVSRKWMAVVAAALLLGTLVGAVWARPNDRPGAAESTRKITLGTADFHPTEDDYDFYAGAEYLYCYTGTCYFKAAIDFPTLGAVTVERIRLHVTDYNASEMAIAYLYRANPSLGTMAFLGSAQSPPGESGGLQTYDSLAMNKVVWPSQRAHILLFLGGQDMDVYGVTVEYHRNM